MAVEVFWDDIDEVKEIIADIRDADCDLKWVIFGYEDAQQKKLVVVEAGDSGLEELANTLEDDRVMYAFLEVDERCFALFQWLPTAASGISKARAAVHRSFITSMLGNVAIDIVAHSREDISQEKIQEEISYHLATQGRSLNDVDAARKLQEEKERKQEAIKRQAMAGNTKEAQQRLAVLSSGPSVPAKHLAHAPGTNVAKNQPTKSHASSLFEKAKVDICLEDEDNLRDLLLDLKEPDREDFDDFNWMIIGYVEDKKNTLTLVETGNDEREGIADYIKTEMGGGLDKVMYLILKENNASNKCTFISWIGKHVPAFKRANSSTHRGSITTWMTTVVHNLQEEYVQSCNDLLGLKDDSEEEAAVEQGESEATPSIMAELERSMSTKSYSGKVLDEVQRQKTPHEQWLERKLALKDSPRLNSNRLSVGEMNQSVNKEQEFMQVLAKKKEAKEANNSVSTKRAGKSKAAQQKRTGSLDTKEAEAIALASRSSSSNNANTHEGVSRDSSEGLLREGLLCDVHEGLPCDTSELASRDAHEGLSRDTLNAMAQQANDEALKYEEEAAISRERAHSYKMAALDAGSPKKAGDSSPSKDTDISTSPTKCTDSSTDEGRDEAAHAERGDAEEEGGRHRTGSDGSVKRKGDEEQLQREMEEEEEAKKQEMIKIEEARRMEEVQRKRADEQRAAESKAREDAEAEAQAKEKAEAEAEAKVKAEAEARAKAEAEAKHEAEAEAKAKIQAEEKEKLEAKAKAEAKAKSEAEAKEKAEAENRAKADAEAKRRAEEETKAKAEAEAREKAEAEAKVRGEAQAKEKEEAAARAKREEEDKVAREKEEAAEREKEKEREAARKADEERIAREKDKLIREREEEERKVHAARIAEEDRERDRLRAEQEAVARDARLAVAKKAQEEARARAEQELAARREAREAGGDTATRKSELLAEADASKRSEDDAIRRKAGELLARKKALLEEASRKQAAHASGTDTARGRLVADTTQRKTELVRSLADSNDSDRLRRAEEFRQRRMAELANRKGGESDAAAKKAAFLREAEEAVKRAALQEADKKRTIDEDRMRKIPVSTGSLTAALSDDDSDSGPGTPRTPPSPTGAGTKVKLASVRA